MMVLYVKLAMCDVSLFYCCCFFLFFSLVFDLFMKVIWKKVMLSDVDFNFFFLCVCVYVCVCVCSDDDFSYVGRRKRNDIDNRKKYYTSIITTSYSSSSLYTQHKRFRHS